MLTFSTQLRRLATGFMGILYGDLIEWTSLSLVSIKNIRKTPLPQCNMQISPPSAIAPSPYHIWSLYRIFYRKVMGFIEVL